MFIWAMFGVGIQRRLAELFFFNKIDTKDSKIGFEMSLIVVEAIREGCASFTILRATLTTGVAQGR